MYPLVLYVTFEAFGGIRDLCPKLTVGPTEEFIHPPSVPVVYKLKQTEPRVDMFEVSHAEELGSH